MPPKAPPSTANGPERVALPTPNPSPNGPFGNIRNALGKVGSNYPVNPPATDVDAVTVLNSTLERFLAAQLQQTANDVRSNLTEHYSAEYGTTSLTWEAETRDPWWWEGLLVILPVGQTSATLQVGEYTFPIQNTTEIITPLRLMTTGTRRTLTWSTASTTVKASVTLWGRVAVWRGGAPGVGPISTPGRVL